MSNTYDRIASFYDCLSLVLGKPYRESKSIFLEKLEKGHQVLYLGGGTGINLPLILEKIGREGKVFYMEASPKMIKKARSRLTCEEASCVAFLHRSDFSKIPLDAFDVVLTQFFLDILPDYEIEKLLQEVEQRAKQDARWIFLDFFPLAGRKWLIKLMILFFKVFTGNLRSELPNYGFYFAYYGWEIQERKLIDKGFIQGWLLKRGNGDLER